MEVVQIKNPATFTIPAIADLLARALAKTQNISDDLRPTVAQDIINMTVDPNAFIFLGAEDGEFKLVFMGFLPVSNLFPHPTVVSFYSEGSRALRELGKQKLIDYIRESGYNHAWAVNGTGNSDKAWERVFRNADTIEFKKIGTVFQIDIT